MPTKIRRIDRYIFTEVLGPFVGAFVFLCFVFLMFQVLRLAEFLIVHSIPIFVILKMVFLQILAFVPFSLSIAVLIATLMGFGRLSADSELIALKSNGIGMWRISAPVFGFAGMVALLGLFLNLEWCPWGDRVIHQTIIKIGNTKVAASLRQGTFTTGFFDLLIFADQIDSKTNTLKKIFIFDEREPENPLTVVAQEGRIVPLETDSDFDSETVLALKDGNIHTQNVEDQTYSRIHFDQYDLYLKIHEGESTADEKPRMWSLSRLRYQIGITQPNEFHGRVARTELWRRITVALSSIAFVFLGIGYGTIRTRSVRGGAAVITTAVLFIYWFVLLWAIDWSEKGFLIPAITMQIPNLVVLLPGLYAWRKAAW